MDPRLREDDKTLNIELFHIFITDWGHTLKEHFLKVNTYDRRKYFF